MKVFLRPMILRSADDSHGVTADRYDYIRQLQGDSRLPPHWLLPEFPPSDLPPMPGRPQAGEQARPAASTRTPSSLAPDIDEAVRRREPGYQQQPGPPADSRVAPGAPSSGLPGTVPVQSSGAIQTAPNEVIVPLRRPAQTAPAESPGSTGPESAGGRPSD